MLDLSIKTFLQQTTSRLVMKGKGLLAADESIETAGKRFALIGIEDTEKNRLAFRKMLLTAKGAGQYISGVILFDETIRESVDGKPFVEILKEEGILPGIKVDKGLVLTPNGLHTTQGLQGLDTRLKEYVNLGATFCKWRCLFLVGKTTDENIVQNAQGMVEYAILCQQNGLVPIVEPEILMEGNHSREEAGATSEKVLHILFQELQKADAYLPGLILKTSMVIKGKKSTQKETPEDVAKATIDVFKKTVPHNLGGVVFLSGGQTELQATENLEAICSLNSLSYPITFSYSRALEESAILAWKGKEEDIAVAQKIYLHRAKMNSLATLGKYNPSLEKSA